MGEGMSFAGSRPRTGARKIRLYTKPCAVAAPESQLLRRSNRKRNLAVQQSRRIPSLARFNNPVLCVSSWNAGPVVQTHLSAQASQEMALLALGRISSPASRASGLLHQRRGAPIGSAVVLAVPLPRGGGLLRNGDARRQY